MKQYRELHGRLEPWLLLMGAAGAAIGLAALVHSATRVRALFGTVLSLTGIVLSIGILPVSIKLCPGSGSRRKVQCLANVKNLSIAVQMYVNDWDHFPSQDTWTTDISEYIKNDNIMICPDVMRVREWRTGQVDTLVADIEAGRWPGSYAYNANLSGVPEWDLDDPAQVISIFESDAGWNAAGGPELLPKEPRHMEGENYGFTDGHAKFFLRTAVQDPESGVKWEAVRSRSR